MSKTKENLTMLYKDNGKEIYQADKNNKIICARLKNRIIAGRSVMPCDRECREYGFDIGSTTKHTSFENFKQLMNDSDFIIELAKLTPNPKKCENYFYQYVNPYLKSNKNFRLEFLKSVYLNDDVYNIESINYVVELCSLEKENEKLLNSADFANVLKQRLEELSTPPMLAFNLDGKDRKAMRSHKIKQNEARVRWENQKKGIEEILNTFTVNKKKTELWDF